MLQKINYLFCKQTDRLNLKKVVRFNKEVPMQPKSDMVDTRKNALIDISKNIFFRNKQYKLECFEYGNEMKALLEYVMAKKDYDSILNDSKYTKKLFKISDLLYREGNKNHYLFQIFEYEKIIEHLISIINLTKDCVHVSIVEYFGRKQCEKHEFHDELHNLEKCVRAFDIFYLVINIVGSCTDFSKLFRLKFNYLGGTTALYKFLSAKDILFNLNLIEQINKNRNGEVLNLYKTCLHIIKNLSKNIDLDPKSTMSIITNFIEYMKFDDEQIIICYTILAKILTEKYLEKLKYINRVIILLVDLVKTGARSIQNESTTVRVNVELDDSEIGKVCVIDSTEFFININDLLDTLFYFNNNERLRREIDNYDLINDLKTIILFGKDTEVEQALRILFQYCFDERLVEKLRADSDLRIILNNIDEFYNKSPDSIKLEVIKYTKGILWKLGKDDVYSEVDFIKKPDDGVKKIYFSCHNSDREIFIKIEEYLKENGFKVWFKGADEFNLNRNILAIKNSDCILMGISKKYKNDLICRLEAELGKEIKKVVIPLDLEREFLLDGWLKDIVQDKVYIDFNRFELDRSKECLLKEINDCLSNGQETITESQTS